MLSALGSLYGAESPVFLRECLWSLATQERRAEEVVIVCDGPVGPELMAVVADFSKRLPLRIVRLQENVGLGAALNAGLRECRGDLVARFDTDDVNLPGRFRLQEQLFNSLPELDIASCAILEVEMVNGRARAGKLRTVPVTHDEIARQLWLRNPLNHPGVMFRAESARRFGGYVEHRAFEDFLTWALWISRGARAANLEEPLVLMRAGAPSMHRRGGLRYMRLEVGAGIFLYRLQVITFWRLILFLLARLPVRVLPARLRLWVYRGLLRQEPITREGVDDRQ